MEKISLDGRTVSKRRIFFIALFLCIGIAAFVYAFTHLGGNRKGWQNVALDRVTEGSVCFDFSFTYEFGKSGKSVNKERSGLISCYRKLTTDAYRIFDRRQEYEGLSNLCTVNRHPNETVEVDPALYNAFAAYAKDGGRMLYLGALTEHYEVWITSDSEEALSETDPFKNPDVMEFFRKTAEYAADENAVRLELCGDNKVILHVSDAYLAFAAANDIVDFVDFGWARNAVIVDYLADGLTNAGYRRGILTSYDGFTRNFCDYGGSFDYSLIVSKNGEPANAGTMTYQGKMSFVWFHSYPANSYDAMFRVRTLADGRIRNTYLGTDGLPHSNLPELLAWSEADSCTDIALSMAKYYIIDHYSGDDLRAGAGAKGISVLTAEEAGLLHTNDWNVTFDGNTRTIVRVPYSVE